MLRRSACAPTLPCLAGEGPCSVRAFGSAAAINRCDERFCAPSPAYGRRTTRDCVSLEALRTDVSKNLDDSIALLATSCENPLCPTAQCSTSFCGWLSHYRPLRRSGPLHSWNVSGHMVRLKTFLDARASAEKMSCRKPCALRCLVADA